MPYVDCDRSICFVGQLHKYEANWVGTGAISQSLTIVLLTFYWLRDKTVDKVTTVGVDTCYNYCNGRYERSHQIAARAQQHNFIALSGLQYQIPCNEFNYKQFPNDQLHFIYNVLFSNFPSFE